jgi:hypothetical protein
MLGPDSNSAATTCKYKRRDPSGSNSTGKRLCPDQIGSGPVPRSARRGQPPGSVKVQGIENETLVGPWPLANSRAFSVQADV